MLPEMPLKSRVIFLLLVAILTSTANAGIEPKQRKPPTNLLELITFPATTTEDPVKPSLDRMEVFLKNASSAAVRKVLPRFMKLAENVNVSSTCLSSLLKYVSSLKQIKTWAVRMFDASAKIPSGVFDGTVTEFGAFEQCVNILVKNKKGIEDFRGQYCSVEAVPILGPRPRNLSLAILPDVDPNDSIIKEMYITIFAFYHLTLRLGVCVPSTCSKEDMQALSTQVVKSLSYGIKVSKCHVFQEIRVDPIHIAVLTVVTLLVAITITGTVLDYRRNMKKKRIGKIPTKGGRFQQVALAFSLPSNFRKLVSVQNSNEMKSLHGIRALSMTWVILGHTYIWINFQALRKSSRASQWFNDIEFEVILNGWVTVASFVFLSGLLTTYTTLKYMETSNGRLNIFLYVLRRFLRLYPSLLFVLGSIFFLPWIASGPFWPELPGIEVENCKRYWWSNLLFINNWRPFRLMCMQHSWYIAADMQLHVIALLVLIPLFRKAFFGLMSALFLSVAGILAVGIITYVNDYDPTILISTANIQNMYSIAEDIHIKTYTYLGPYCVGVVTGFLLLKYPKMKLGKMFKMAGWCCAATLSICSLYGVHRWNIGQFHGPLLTSIYAAFHRTTFVIGLAWVSLLCITGNARMVSSLLKMRPLVFMSRLTFMAYLTQGPVIWTRYGSLKERLFYSHFNMLYEYLGNLILSLALAFVGHLLVEAPFANLERLLFSCGKKPSTKESEVQGVVSTRGEEPKVDKSTTMEDTHFKTQTNKVS